MLKILSIGDLVEPGTYDFLNGFRRVVNLTDGKRVVTLALPGIDRGPLNVIVAGSRPRRGASASSSSAAPSLVVDERLREFGDG